MPPQAPSSYSCTLAEGSGNSTRVTLTWTEPPGGDNIDQYCITSSPEYPSARSVCVTPDVRTHQYEVQQGTEYNFTILAVNCGNQNGTETAPISVFPQGMCVCVTSNKKEPKNVQRCRYVGVACPKGAKQVYVKQDE